MARPRSVQCVVIIVVLVCLAHPSLATTWDEPWHETVVREADSFVLLEVLSNDKGKSITAKVLARLAGKKTAQTVTVDGFHRLRLTSRSAGHPPGFRFPKGFRSYFLLKKAKNSHQVATPTAGWAALNEGVVTATYRHSCHKALVRKELYEKSMTAIFKHLHGKKHDQEFIRGLFQKYLAQPPSDIDPSDVRGKASTLFFEQHVALECFVYFGEERDLKLLEPFLESSGAHVQISAARALSRINTDAAKQRLVAFIEADRDAFAKVMAVWGLRRLNATGQAERLKKYVASSNKETCGFGGSIMDPRVGTRFPGSVKGAIRRLLEEWKTGKRIPLPYGPFIDVGPGR